MTHLLTTLSTALIDCDMVLSAKFGGDDPEVNAALQRSMDARKAFADAFPDPETIAAPVRVLVNVTNPHDMDAAPDYATILVDDQFIARLRHLQGVCKALNLDSVQVSSCPESWHYLGDNNEDEDDHRTELDYLSVSADMFYFTAVPKHHDHAFEAEAQMIGDFIKRALACQDDYLILAGGVDEEELDEIRGLSNSAAPSL